MGAYEKHACARFNTPQPQQAHNKQQHGTLVKWTLMDKRIKARTRHKHLKHGLQRTGKTGGPQSCTIEREHAYAVPKKWKKYSHVREMVSKEECQ